MEVFIQYFLTDTAHILYWISFRVVGHVSVILYQNNEQFFYNEKRINLRKDVVLLKFHLEKSIPCHYFLSIAFRVVAFFWLIVSSFEERKKILLLGSFSHSDLSRSSKQKISFRIIQKFREFEKKNIYFLLQFFLELREFDSCQFIYFLTYLIRASKILSRMMKVGRELFGSPYQSKLIWSKLVGPNDKNQF